MLNGSKSRFLGQVHVSHIIIYGEIHGNIMAEKKLEINVPGKVFGNIESPVVTIETGAVLEGNCRTQPPEIVEKDALKVEMVK